MAIQDDVRKFILEINESKNNGDTLAGLTKLEKETAKLRQENENLEKVMAHLSARGDKNTDTFRQMEAQLKSNKSAVAANNLEMKGLSKTLDIAYMSSGMLSKRANELRSTLADMSKAANPEEYARLETELKQVTTQMGNLKGKTNETKGVLDELRGVAGGLLPAFGFAAIVAGAVAALGKIKNSTDDFSKDWDAMTNGLNEGMNEFWRTIATGDWSNFSDRMREAIRLGEEYINTIDDIEDKTRSISVREAESKKTEMDLEIKLRNRLLNKDERIKAGKERIALEEGLTADRIKLAQEVYDNEAKLTAFQTKLSKDQLINITRDLDSESKIRANAYNDQLDQYEKLKKANVAVVGGGNMGGGTMVALKDTPEMIRLKELMDATTAADKLYADQIRSTGRTTDEQLDKMIGAYVKLQEAGVSGKENVKKIITQVNSLLAGEEENGQKLENKAAKARKEASDKAIADIEAFQNHEMSLLATKYTTEGMTDAKFKAEQELLDVQFLLKKQSILAEHGQSTVDIDRQINEKRIQAQKEFNDEMLKVYAENDKNYSAPDLSSADMGIDPASMVAAEDIEFASKKHSIDEWTAYLIEKTNEQLKIKKQAFDNEKAIEQARRELTDTQIGGMEQIAGAMSSMFEQGSAAQIAFFAIEKAAAIAQVWINYARESSAIAATAAAMNLVSFGVAGTAWAAVMQPKALLNAGINTGIIAAQAIAQVAGGSKKSGGFTGSSTDDNEVKGVYHANEWFANAKSVRENPAFFAALDAAQRNGTTRNFVDAVSGVSLSRTTTQGRQSETFTSSGSASAASTSPVVIPGSTRDPELTAAINNMSRAVAVLVKNGVQFPIVPFKKELDEISDLIDQTGMGGFKKQ